MYSYLRNEEPASPCKPFIHMSCYRWLHVQLFWLRLCNAATSARLVKENIKQSKRKREERTDSVDNDD